MNQYISLAKKAVENYIKERKTISPSKNLPEEFLTRKAGTFVTIEKDENLRGAPRDERKRVLRGCIGTYLPTKENIAQEIIHNAIVAATEDYRFSPIQKQELPELSYTVYILNKPELIKSINELDPKKYGILVKSQSFSSGSDVIFEPAPRTHFKSGLLLPDLDGVDTSEKQISIACQKANINPQTEKIIIYKFKVEKYQ
ncbi:AMMECR1 domain-containing protein [Candidatus Parcubacteria bacterium]|nr:AMMECR1 domain-containing protein [Candidatus Parcubacteria bacterium]